MQSLVRYRWSCGILIAWDSYTIPGRRVVSDTGILYIHCRKLSLYPRAGAVFFSPCFNYFIVISFQLSLLGPTARHPRVCLRRPMTANPKTRLQTIYCPFQSIQIPCMFHVENMREIFVVLLPKIPLPKCEMSLKTSWDSIPLLWKDLQNEVVH